MTIKVSDIKWAYRREIGSNPVKGFIDSLFLFIGEILRSDEIGLIMWRDQPILMLRIDKVDFNSKETYIEAINFEDSGFEKMLIELDLHNKPSAIIFSGFELFCYRPKPDKPYHPKMHPTYIRARELASRILNGIWMLARTPKEGAYVALAQVDEKTSTNFFKKTSNQNQFKDKAMKFETAVVSWIEEFYSDEIGSKQYKTKNRYPLAPKPLEGCQLFVVTSDDDGNFIAYEDEV